MQHVREWSIGCRCLLGRLYRGLHMLLKQAKHQALSCPGGGLSEKLPISWYGALKMELLESWEMVSREYTESLGYLFPRGNIAPNRKAIP